jgi:hypothetical protein
MTVKEILTEYLKSNGFDGLCGFDCGCPLDDLIPCSDASDLCVPGYKTPCDCGGGCEYHISETKEKQEEKDDS